MKRLWRFAYRATAPHAHYTPPWRWWMFRIALFCAGRAAPIPPAKLPR